MIRARLHKLVWGHWPDYYLYGRAYTGCRVCDAEDDALRTKRAAKLAKRNAEVRAKTDSNKAG